MCIRYDGVRGTGYHVPVYALVEPVTHVPVTSFLKVHATTSKVENRVRWGGKEKPNSSLPATNELEP